MVAGVIFAAGTLQALLALVGRIPYLLFYGIGLMIISLFLTNTSRKWSRILCAVICTAACAWCVYRSSVYGIGAYDYYKISAITCGLQAAFVLTSMLPEKGSARDRK